MGDTMGDRGLRRAGLRVGARTGAVTLIQRFGSVQLLTGSRVWRSRNHTSTTWTIPSRPMKSPGFLV